MKKTISFSKIIFWTGAISLLLVYIILWAEMIASPSERTGTDFIAFYSAGRIAQERGSSKVYDIDLQQEVQENLLGFSIIDNQPLLYNHLPFLIPLLKLIMQESYTLSFSIWLLIQITIYGVSFYILAQLFPENWTQNNRGKIITSGALFFPVFVSLLLGQDTAFLFLGISLFFYGILRQKDFLAGGGLALTLVRPHLTLALALPVMIKNKKAFSYFVGLGAALALLSFGILGIEGTQDFIRILTISGEGTWYGMKEASMINLIGLMSRTFSFLGPSLIQTIGWVLYFISIVILFFFWTFTAKETSSLLGLSVIFSLFFAPHLHYHDLSLLFFPLMLILVSRKLSLRQEKVSFVLLAISFLLISTKSIPFLYFSFPYSLLLGMTILLIGKQGITQSQNPP
ncbi:MAG: DUF2029 domain-containing protein [Anaerolineae bacterium]|nr:DUF2029 domain-containing protein [Anaerolineae bacterium]